MSISGICEGSGRGLVAMRLQGRRSSRCRRAFVLVAAAGVAATVQAFPATAQDAPAGGASPSAGAGGAPNADQAPVPIDHPATSATGTAPATSTQLDEIVVTATKRAQSVRDIPTTIDVLTGAKLEAKGARDLTDFIDLVPGIKMEEQSGDTPRKIAIRGAGPGDTTNQTVGTVIGDVPLSDPYGNYTLVDPDPWDLKTVEVLKGPQGTLFGASSLAGLIRYVPNDPTLDDWDGKAFSEWVSVKHGGTEPTYGAELNAPLLHSLAFRASGVVQHDPGYIDVDTVDRQVPNANFTHKWEGRAMLLWQPVPRLTVNAWVMNQEFHADEGSFVNNFNGQLTRPDAPSPSPVHTAFSLAVLDTRYAFNWATLVSLSSLQHKINVFNLDSTYTLPGEMVAEEGISVTRALRNVHANGFVQELRLVSPDRGPWTWMLGGFFSVYRAAVESDVYLADTGGLSTLTAPLSGNLLGIQLNPATLATSPEGASVAFDDLKPANAGERAVFGELTRKLGSRWDLTLGARLYRTTIGATASTGGLLYAATSPTVNTQQLAVASEGVSPKAAVTYRATRDILFYASAARGFQFGGVNLLVDNIDGDPATFKSSTLWNYELGTRTDWFHKTLRFDLTAFYIDWHNAQVSQEDAQDINTYVDNVGAVRSFGLENSFRYLFPLKGLSIEVATAYVKAKTTVPYQSGGAYVPAGTVMPNSPTVQVANTLAYQYLLGPWRIQPALEYIHVDSSWNDIEHDHGIQVRNPLNFNLSLSRPDLRIAPAISLVVDNITNEDKIESVHAGSAATSGVAAAGDPVIYSRPRTIEVKLSASF